LSFSAAVRRRKAKARQCFNRCGCNPAAAGFETNQSIHHRQLSLYVLYFSLNIYKNQTGMLIFCKEVLGSK
jgi:hypothetical protein